MNFVFAKFKLTDKIENYCDKQQHNTRNHSYQNSSLLSQYISLFVTRQISSGRYGSVSEVIRAGLRKLEDEEKKLETLRALIEEGKASGTADYSYESLMQELDDELGG
jgi:antitoxin ParD1/3/4